MMLRSVITLYIIVAATCRDDFSEDDWEELASGQGGTVASDATVPASAPALPSSTVSYSRVNSGQCSDVSGRSTITTQSDCEAAAVRLGLSDTTVSGSGSAASSRPAGCSYASNDWLTLGLATSSVSCGTDHSGSTYDCICRIDGTAWTLTAGADPSSLFSWTPPYATSGIARNVCDYTRTPYVCVDQPNYCPKGIIDGLDANGCAKAKYFHLVVPSGVTSIPDKAFWGCSYLRTITLPDSITSIGNGAFEETKSFSTINIPESVTAIGNSAFFRTRLTSIDIPGSVVLGDEVFGVAPLTSVTLHEGLKIIPRGTFNSCQHLKSITIPSTVTAIGDTAFGYNHELTSVTFAAGSQLENIRSMAFTNCKTLVVKDISIPSAAAIDRDAFLMTPGPGGCAVSCPSSGQSCACNPTLALLRERGVISADPSCEYGIKYTQKGTLISTKGSVPYQSFHYGPTVTYCCATSCGKCGFSGCSSRPGGSKKCCPGQLRKSKKNCADNAAPCYFTAKTPATGWGYTGVTTPPQCEQDWTERPKSEAKGNIDYTGSDHGCSTAHGQCFWTDLETAKTQCAAWDECKALYCSSTHNRGQHVCYARAGTSWGWNQEGDTSYSAPCTGSGSGSGSTPPPTPPPPTTPPPTTPPPSSSPMSADPSCEHGIKYKSKGALTTYCCATSCGKCGGRGCSSRPGGSKKCCPGQLRKSKRKCADNTAPCYYKGAVEELVVEDMWTEG